MRTQKETLLRAMCMAALVEVVAACNEQSGFFAVEYSVGVSNQGSGSGLVGWSIDITEKLSCVGQNYCGSLKILDAGGGGGFTLTATPYAGFHFSAWGRDCAGTVRTSPCGLGWASGQASIGNTVDVRFERPYAAPPQAAVNVVQGAPVTTTIQVRRAPGFTQPIAISLSLQQPSPAPAGLSVVLTQVSSPSPTMDEWAITASAAGSVPPSGMSPYSVDVALSGGGFDTTTQVAITVVAAPPSGDFSISVPATVTLGAGNTTAVPVTIVRNGATGPVDLSVGGLPQGVTSSPLTVPANATTATLTIDATNAPLLLPANAPATIRIDGVVAGLPPRSTTFALTIDPATLMLVPAVGSVTLVPGASQTKTILVGRSTPAIGAVNLAAAGSNPIGVTPVVVAAAQVSGSIVLSAPLGTAAGAYNVIVSGTALGGALVATTSIPVTVNVPSVTGRLVANPAAVVLEPGLPGGSVTVGSSSAIWLGHSGPEVLALSATVQPAAPGLSVAFSQPSMTGPVAAAVIGATPSTTPGTYTVTITGQGTTVTRSTSITVTVRYVTDFSLGLANPLQWALNTNYSYTGFNSIGLFFNGNVTLSIPDVPLGVFPTFVPPTVAPGQVASLGVVAGPYTSSGLHIFTLTGTSGALTRTQRVLAIVHGQSAIPGILGVIPPGALTVSLNPVGNTVVTTDVVIARTLSTALTSLTMSVSGLPSGVQATFSSNPVNASAVAMTLTATSAVARGTYTLDVTATGGPPNVKAQVLLTVQ